MRITPTKSSFHIVLFLFLQLSCIPPVFSATRVDHLYAVEMPVANQGHQERARAIRQGMVEVLTRISGAQALEKFGQLLEVLDKSSRYVLQYRYEQKPPAADAAPGTPPTVVILLQFDGKAILKLVQQQQLPIWGETRPETLIWLAVENQGERFLQGNDSTSDIYTRLLEAATRRGVPILFPLLDLEDQEKVRTADVWGGFSEVLRRSSARYAVENMLSGRLFQNSRNEWEAHWTYIGRTDEVRWSVKGADLGQVLSAGVDGLAEQLVARYAFRTDVVDDSSYLLRVANVNAIDGYARLEEYLSTVTLISRVELVRVEKDSVTYLLKLRGTLENLTQFFSLGNMLVPADQPPLANGVETNLKPVAGQPPVTAALPVIQTIYYKLKP